MLPKAVTWQENYGEADHLNQGFYIHPEQMPQCSEWTNKGLVEFCLILICASVISVGK